MGSIEFCEVILEADPDDLAIRVRLGWLYESERHDFDAAVAHLRTALEKQPESAEAGFWLAKVYFHHYSLLAEAQEVLEQVLAKHPGHVPSLGLLGSVYLELDESARALDRLTQAIELAPTWISLHREAANAYVKLGDFASSARHAKIAVKLARDFHAVSTPDSYSYFEAVVTGRWVDDQALSQVMSHITTRTR